MSQGGDSFTRGASRSRSRRGRSYRNPKGVYDYFRLDSAWQTIRIIEGEYKQTVFDAHTGEVDEDVLPYYSIDQHWDPVKRRYRNCSAGPNEFNPEPCVGCSIDKDSGNDTRRPYFVFTILHLAWYHKTPLMEKDNPNKIRRKKDGKPVMVDRLCEGRNCPMCASGDEKFFGKRLHWKVGTGHFDQLKAKAEELNATCRCGEEIRHIKFECPICESTLVDLDQDTTLTDKDVWHIRENGYHCETCGHMVDVLAVPECTGCESPDPVNIFDVNMDVRSISGKGNYTALDVKFSDPCPIPEDYEGPQEPLDLKEIFAPLPITEQRKEYGYRGPISNTSESDTEEYE